MLGKRWLASVAALSVVLTALVPLGATAASAVDNAVLQLKKSLVGDQTVFAPGDTFEYEIVVGCSSTLDLGCLDAALTDALPEPLVLNPANPDPVTASVAPDGTADVVLDGTTGFTVTPRQEDSDGNIGLLAGGTMTVTVNVQVPTGTSGDFDGAKITNTAHADAGNAAEVQSSADVTLRVDTTLAASLSKRVSPTTVPAVPGRSVEWTIAPGNASNQTVDTIVMQDPAAPPFAFAPNLELAGVDVTDPAGATGHEVEYWVTGTWTNAPPNPIGSAGGVRVSFTGSFAPGATGEVKLRTRTTDAVAAIPEGGSVTASFFQSPVELPRDRILRAAATRVATGGHLVLVSHAAAPSWAPGHGGDFPSPASELAMLDPAPDDWDTVTAEVRTRAITAPDGEPATLDDTVVVLRRR